MHAMSRLKSIIKNFLGWSGDFLGLTIAIFICIIFCVCQQYRANFNHIAFTKFVGIGLPVQFYLHEAIKSEVGRTLQDIAKYRNLSQVLFPCRTICVWRTRAMRALSRKRWQPFISIIWFSFCSILKTTKSIQKTRHCVLFYYFYRRANFFLSWLTENM